MKTQYRGLLDKNDGADVEPMDRQGCKVFLTILIADAAKNKERYAGAFDIKGYHIPRIMQDRAEFALGCDLTDFATEEAWMMVWGIANPATFGEAVMWVYALALAAVELKRPVSLPDMVTKLYPLGYPVKAAKDEAWIAQKGRSMGEGWENVDNALDSPRLWQPIVEALVSHGIIEPKTNG